MTSTSVEVMSAEWSPSETRDGKSLVVKYSIGDIVRWIIVFLPDFLVQSRAGWKLSEEDTRKALFGYAKEEITHRVLDNIPLEKSISINLDSKHDPHPPLDLPDIGTFEIEG